MHQLLICVVSLCFKFAVGNMSFCFLLWKQCFVVNTNDTDHVISWGFCFNNFFVIDAAAWWCVL